MFTLRRLLFAVSIVYLDDHLIIQLIVNMLLSVAMIIYIGKVCPWESKFNNKLEQFNEFSCLILQYHQLTFTDLNPDVEVKSGPIANSFKYSTYVIIAVNCFLIGL